MSPCYGTADTDHRRSVARELNFSRNAWLLSSFRSAFGVMRKHLHQVTGSNDARRFAIRQWLRPAVRTQGDIHLICFCFRAQRADRETLFLVMLERIEIEKTHGIFMSNLVN